MEWPNDLTGDKLRWYMDLIPKERQQALYALALAAILAFLALNILALYWAKDKNLTAAAPEKILTWAVASLFGLFAAIGETCSKGRDKILGTIWMLCAGGSLAYIPIRWVLHQAYNERGTLMALLVSGGVFLLVLFSGGLGVLAQRYVNLSDS